MALTRRQNGSTSASLVTSAWWNDYLDLISGVMVDQLINPTATIQSQALPSTLPANPTCAAVSGSGLSVGSYTYYVAFQGPNGIGALSNGGTAVTTTTGSQKVNVTNIATGPAGVTARIIYRTKVNPGSLAPIYQVAVINDNTTTTYTDTTADTSLTVASNPWPTLGGTVQVLDGTDVVQASMTYDGQVWAKGVYRWGGTLGSTNRQVLDMVPTDGPRIGLNYNYNGGSGGVALYNYTTGVFLFQLNGATGVITTPVGTVAAVATSGQSGRIFVQTATPSSPQQGDIWFKV